METLDAKGRWEGNYAGTSRAIDRYAHMARIGNTQPPRCRIYALACPSVDDPRPNHMGIMNRLPTKSVVGLREDQNFSWVRTRSTAGTPLVLSPWDLPGRPGAPQQAPVQ